MSESKKFQKPASGLRRARANSTAIQPLSSSLEADAAHHLAGPFLPQTPLNSPTPERVASPVNRYGKPSGQKKVSFFLRWAVDPLAAFQLAALPVILYFNWELLASKLAFGIPNPFGVFLLSGHVPTSPSDDPRYTKSRGDFTFIAYYIVFFSFVRQVIAVEVCRRVAKYFGLKKESKLDRFGEQGYAMVYFAFFGAWGFRIMSQLPTYWYRTEYFWREYPNVEMTAELKRYYLMQSSYWFQQLLVLVLGLEKPRKDYLELVAHHFVTLWLICWSYYLHFTWIGNAVYMSMDIPDAFLAFSKILNYIQWDRAKVVAFATFVVVWTYFRHWLNLVILWSVATESHNVPESVKVWDFETGAYFQNWVRHQILLAIGLLQLLNLFWYYLILRILVRTIVTKETDDDRSDHEDGEEEGDGKED